MITDAVELRKTLAVGLEPILGRYKLPDGLEVEAIAVSVRGEYPPQGTVVSGLEVSIVPDAQVEFSARNSGGGVLTGTSRIEVRQWDKSSTVLPAIERICKILDNIEIGRRLLTDDRFDSVESVTLTYRHFEVRH